MKSVREEILEQLWGATKRPILINLDSESFLQLIRQVKPGDAILLHEGAAIKCFGLPLNILHTKDHVAEVQTI